MIIENTWNQFIEQLTMHKVIKTCTYQKIAGIPFLYIHVNQIINQKDLEHIICTHSANVMKGKQLHSETIFVRVDHPIYVFRHRFYVPLKKMFCCGNLCVDCVRFTKINS